MTQSALDETKNAFMYGAEYKPDATSIAANVITSMLFGSLEAFKSNPKAMELQNRLKQGDVSAQKETADFLNEQSQAYNPLLTAQEQAEQYIKQWPETQGVESGDVNGYNWDEIYKEAVWVTGGNRVLWSGGKKAFEVATDFATQNGLKTLEQTSTGKMLTTCQNIANRIFRAEKAYQLLSPLWDKASARFVRGADGVIHAFLNSQGISDTSVFTRIEYEIAKERDLKMIFHLVK